eukprot:10006926-Ditylum_brightwellii.AAC.1
MVSSQVCRECTGLKGMQNPLSPIKTLTNPVSHPYPPKPITELPPPPTAHPVTSLSPHNLPLSTQYQFLLPTGKSKMKPTTSSVGLDTGSKDELAKQVKTMAEMMRQRGEKAVDAKQRDEALVTIDFLLTDAIATFRV